MKLRKLRRQSAPLVVAVALAASLALTATAGCDDGGPRRTPLRPLPPTEPPTGALPNSASFLMDGAAARIMNGLSAALPDSAFDARLAACLANGDDTMALYVTNRGDGVPPITSFYVDDTYGGEVAPARVAAMRNRLERCRDAGLALHLWVWSDDSRFGDESDATHEAHLDRCVEAFDDLADVWCVGLELDEVFSDRDRVVRLTDALRARTSKPVGVHFTSLKPWRWAVAADADVLFGQYGFERDASDIRRLTKGVVDDLDGRVAFWAWEYHLSSRSDEAKALGDAAFEVTGCVGTGNGRHRPGERAEERAE